MRVFVVAYGGGHITMVAPVMERLRAMGAECILLAPTTGYLKAKQLGLAPLGYRDFAHLVPRLDRVLEWGRALHPENSHPDVDAVESHHYLGVNFAQWADELGEAGAWERYRSEGRRAFSPVRFMDAVIRELAPDAILTTNTPRTEGAAIEAALSLGVPCLSMVDLFLEPEDPFCRRKLYADKLTVISESVKRTLVSVGIPAKNIAVTGNPAFDSLASPAMLEEARELRKRMGWDGRRVILFAGHAEELPPTPPQWRGQAFASEVQSWLHGWVLAHPGNVLAVRFHPSESHLYPVLPASALHHRSEPSREPLHPLLLASDVVVVQTSTVGLEAALAGKRTVCLKFAPSVHLASYNYADLGLAEGVESWGELADALASSRSGPATDPSAFHVGTASAEVSELVMELGRAGPKRSAQQVPA